AMHFFVEHQPFAQLIGGAAQAALIHEHTRQIKRSETFAVVSALAAEQAKLARGAGRIAASEVGEARAPMQQGTRYSSVSRRVVCGEGFIESVQTIEIENEIEVIHSAVRREFERVLLG